ncbi:MAG TPA: 1-acyl-sn-glycerol-3-phosphate acyltransferase [Thioalkalivibrio sp.]|nr:1-acyl-sn-glycerol-3-phosphate acyltransferase [Thioalkalivibrio sp.]
MNPFRTKPVLYLRGALFWLGFASSTVFFGLLVTLLLPLPNDTRYAIARGWPVFNIWWLKVTCGLRHRLEGVEHVRDLEGAAVVLSKHQSTWETIAFNRFLPRQTYVLKRELMRIPFFGWGASVLRPIAIDRAAGRQAVQQLLEQGKQRLADGIWVVIFPEGTRVLPGQTKRYKIGGAVLATESGYPVIPVAHNAGDFWPRHSLIKHPGEIVVRIGAPIATQGKTPEALNEEVHAWIEGQMREISRQHD